MNIGGGIFNSVYFMSNKNFSYVTLLTNDNYAYGVLLLKETLDRTGCKYPLVCIINEEVCEATKEMLRQVGVELFFQETIPTPAPIYAHNIAKNPGTAQTWRNCWTKLKIFDLTQFDKIVFLDADIMVLKNLDHLFNCPHMTSCLDGEYFNLWPNWDHFNSGCLVIEPKHSLFESIMKFANGLKVEELPNYAIADQEVLNLYYKDWPSQKHLHLNKYYDIFPPYIQEEQNEDVYANGYFLHYVGRKPWTFWIHNKMEKYSERAYTEGKQIVDEVIAKLDWKTIRSKLVLTVYAICKNELENAEKFVKCYSEADHLCIMDTGSTDGTWEKLCELEKQYPNLIIDQRIIKPWRFDTARNESMKIIPKDTSIWFMNDLDEVIKESGWAQKIKDVWTPMFNRGSYSYNRDLNAAGEVIKQIPEYRIHSREWYKWENVVHEALINYHGQKQFWVETCTPVDITVWHYPKKDKKTDYLELCEQDLKENPNDWIMQLQLAIEYEIRQEWQKAFDKFIYIITHKNTLQPFELARCYYGAGRILNESDDKRNLASYYFGMARVVSPSTADSYVFEANEFMKRQNYVPAIELLKHALVRCEGSKWCDTVDINSSIAYYLLGLCYANLGMKLKGLAAIAIAKSRSGSKEIEDLYNNIIRSVQGSDMFYI